MADKSAIGSQQANFNQSVHSIMGNPELSRATDILVMVRDQNGQPRIYTTGDKQAAERLWNEAGRFVGAKETTS